MSNLVRTSRAAKQGVSAWGLAWVPNTEKDCFGSRIQESRPILAQTSVVPWPRGILLPGGGILILHFLLLSFWNKALITCSPGLPTYFLWRNNQPMLQFLSKNLCLLGSVKRKSHPDSLIWFTWQTSATHVLEDRKTCNLIRKKCGIKMFTCHISSRTIKGITKIKFSSLWYCGCNIAARSISKVWIWLLKKGLKNKNQGKKEEIDFLKKENKNREES